MEDIKEEVKKKELKKVDKKEKNTSKKTATKKKPAAKASRKKPAKEPVKIITAKSKRKRATARVMVREGSGRIRINSMDISTIRPKELRRLMQEPVFVSELTRDAAKSVDIEINLKGGGSVSQARAVRTAIAKGLAKFSSNDTIKNEYMRIDRSFLVDDYRRVEPKKFMGPKARARFQTSYR